MDDRDDIIEDLQKRVRELEDQQRLYPPVFTQPLKPQTVTTIQYPNTWAMVNL